MPLFLQLGNLVFTLKPFVGFSLVKRTYIACTNHSIGVIHFDITKNRFVAVGDDYVIKIWDIDNVNLLSTLDAEGGLQVSFL